MQYNYSEKLKTFIDSNATEESLAAKRCFANAQHDSHSEQSHDSHSEQSEESTDTTTLEHKIDELVYKLYGLTEEEIAVMEGE